MNKMGERIESLNFNMKTDSKRQVKFALPKIRVSKKRN